MTDFRVIFAEMVKAWERGDAAETQRLHEEIGTHSRTACPVCQGETPPDSA